MVRVIIAAIVGGIIVFAWGAISWIVLPWHNTSGGELPDEAAIVTALKEMNTEPGTYWIPGIIHGGDLDADAQKVMFEDWQTRHRAGPLGFFVYHPEGREPMAPSVFAQGFVVDVVAALIASILLASAGLKSYLHRFLFILGLGLFVAVISDMTYWVFMFMHTDWTLVNVFDHVAAWGLAGLAIAGIVKPGGG